MASSHYCLADLQHFDILYLGEACVHVLSEGMWGIILLNFKSLVHYLDTSCI
jgi:hypothetical protein